MRVLVACEFSGIVRDAFRERGHDAWSCDLLPTDADPSYHIQDDVRGVIDKRWDLMIAHPPCTRLCNSGVRWLHERNLWGDLKEGAALFRYLLEAAVPRIAVENPREHKYARELIGRRHDQSIQPWQFGHGETKEIRLWLKNLPPLKPTNIVKGREPRVHYASPSKDRWKVRSTFYKGIADAMAEQWGALGAIET